ncbi:MAG: hypothetical protein R3E65_02915 [Steroidobacteraceae bacterium]
MSIGLAAWALAAGAAFADDTEIFVNQGASAGVRPNVLFVVDTSGSMNGGVQLDRPPYDPANVYSGECNRDRVYFQRDTATGTPDCDDDDVSFDAAQNRCVASWPRWPARPVAGPVVPCNRSAMNAGARAPAATILFVDAGPTPGCMAKLTVSPHVGPAMAMLPTPGRRIPTANSTGVSRPSTRCSAAIT